jgi:hypothetical protein
VSGGRRKGSLSAGVTLTGSQAGTRLGSDVRGARQLFPFAIGTSLRC